jgi:hypothetical protein
MLVKSNGGDKGEARSIIAIETKHQHSQQREIDGGAKPVLADISGHSFRLIACFWGMAVVRHRPREPKPDTIKPQLGRLERYFRGNPIEIFDAFTKREASMNNEWIC